MLAPPQADNAIMETMRDWVYYGYKDFVDTETLNSILVTPKPDARPLQLMLAQLLCADESFAISVQTRTKPRLVPMTPQDVKDTQTGFSAIIKYTHNFAIINLDDAINLLQRSVK